MLPCSPYYAPLLGTELGAENYSQAVTHPSTDTAQPCLISVIERELVYSR